MNFEYVRMPKTKDGFAEVFEELRPFLAAMYTPTDIEIHGKEEFFMEQWIFLWDMGHGGLLVAKDDTGHILAVAMCLKSRDLWYAKEKFDIYRYAFNKDVEEPTKVLDDIKDYLVGVASLMNFQELYITKRVTNGPLRGSEIKELVWREAY